MLTNTEQKTTEDLKRALLRKKVLCHLQQHLFPQPFRDILYAITPTDMPRKQQPSLYRDLDSALQCLKRQGHVRYVPGKRAGWVIMPKGDIKYDI